MNPHTKSALLWGIVGFLSFLVLVQGYELLADRGVDLVVKFSVALLVGVTSTATTGYLQRRVDRLPP